MYKRQQHPRPIARVGAARAGVDADDRVRAVGRSGEHALELELAQLLVERVDLRRRVLLGSLVLLLGGQLEVVGDVGELSVDLAQKRELGLDRGAGAQNGLRRLLVVPKAGLERLVVQLVELSFQLGVVKDAPLAPQSAFGGRRACRAFR